MGLSPASFSLWCRQARARGETPSGGAGDQSFAEVVLTPLAGNAPNVARSVLIHVSGHTKIEVAIGTDPVWLAHLLKALAVA